MYICNYCKRKFKESYEICPSCGGKSFSTEAYVGDVVIMNIPNGGWFINHSNLDKINRNNWISILICIVIIIVYIPTIKSVYNYYPSSIMRVISFLIMLPEISVIIYIVITNKKNKTYVKKIDELCQKGMLIKGLPYELVPAKKGMYVNGNALNYCIKINYKNSNGEYIPLVSDIKYDINIRKKDTVDLLIDPSDYSNYYIDFEIF